MTPQNKKIIDATKSIVYYANRRGKAAHENLWNLYHEKTN
ncbi:hypothetical protein LDG_6591 [Legionella drancourtii LLAP12]|uniref:Uncharacterized protein n=1 Tax=Legionella drancourtii LLAP12 TaxID=658187 RepID=G9EMX1_9GAMM|nr:hypothetical protein LDG_6591 [Legionella drancourtii LLAP12]